MGHRPAKVVSGGQTGVDRAALDAALELGIPCGGWCPKGRRAEDGPLPERYPLAQTPSSEYPERTEWNVRDSDATLVLCCGKPSGGTALTIELASRMGRPCLVVDLLKDEKSPREVGDWMAGHGIRVLNVAGPRESLRPGAYLAARSFLREVFRRAG